MRTVIALAVLASLLAACGYKGPLYLPKPNGKQHAPAPAAKPIASAPLAASAPAADSATNTHQNQDKTAP
jgi:predicted small lipoprotein YifL